MRKLCITALLLASSLPLSAATQHDISMFPAAEPSMQRLVIRLPSKPMNPAARLRYCSASS